MLISKLEYIEGFAGLFGFCLINHIMFKKQKLFQKFLPGFIFFFVWCIRKLVVNLYLN